MTETPLDLKEYLARHTPTKSSTAMWGKGTIPLRITGYLADEPPPLAYVTSVRAVVFKGDEVLVQRNRDGYNLLPGGRREPGETLEETLERELLEESGWTLGARSLLAVVHLQHLGPKPPDYRYVYPDFVWVIYVAEAESYRPEAMVDDGYEVDSGFRSVEEARRLVSDEWLILGAALAARGSAGV